VVSKPGAPAPAPGGVYQVLTPADIKAATGIDAQPLPPRRFHCGIGSCGGYADANDQFFLMFVVMTNPHDVDELRTYAPAYTRTGQREIHEQPVGVGDRADLYKDDAESPTERILIVEQGGAGVELITDDTAARITDEQLFALARIALDHYGHGPTDESSHDPATAASR